MLRKEIEEILSAARNDGWIMEPEAKRLLSLAGLQVPKFTWATDVEGAIRFAKKIRKSVWPEVEDVIGPELIKKVSEYIY